MSGDLFVWGMGLGKLKGSCCAVLPLGPVPQKRNPALRTPAWYWHAIITDSLLCPWETEESLYIFFKLNPLDTDTRLLRTVFCPLSIRINGVWKYLKTLGVMWKILPNRFHTMVTFTGWEVRMIFQGCKRRSFCRGMGWGKMIRELSCPRGLSLKKPKLPIVIQSNLALRTPA